MADKKIEDATPDTQVTGVEKIPVSDAGVAKCMTVSQVKDFTLAQIAALASASGIDLSTDGVYLLKGGALKPVASDVLAAAVLDYGFGKVAVASMNGNEVVGVKDASSQKTITVGQLKTWLEANMTVTTDVDIGAKDAAGILSANDLLLIAQSGTNKKLTLTNLVGYAHLAFKDYVTSLTAVDNLNNSDVFYVINGTTAKKCTVSQLKTIIGAGDVIAPDSQTSGNIPAWDSANKKLTNGYGVSSQISDTPSATKLVTEAAVADTVGLKVDKVTGKGLSTNDYTTAEKNKLAGLSDAAMTGASAAADGAKGLVPKPFMGDQNKFLRGDGTWATNTGDITGPSTTTENNVPQWDATTKKLKDGRGLIDEWPTGEDHPDDADRAKIATFALIESESNYNEGTYLKIPYGVTDGNISVFSIEEGEEEGVIDSIGLENGPSIATEQTTIPTGSDHDTYVPTVKRVEKNIQDLAEDIYEASVYTNVTPTAGKVPKWATPGSGQTQQKELADGYAVNTTVGATTSDSNLLTEKAVDDHVKLMGGFAKIAGVLTNNIGTLTNHAAQRFSITTGTNYSLTLPTAVTGRSREFYVAFSQAPAPSGSTATTSEITFANPTGETVEIHSKDGVLSNNKLTLTWDATGSSNAFHVYHFFEDNSQLWCVNMFDFAESNAASDFVGATALAAGSNGLVPAPAQGNVYSYLSSTGEWGVPESFFSRDATDSGSGVEVIVDDAVASYVTCDGSLSSFSVYFDPSSDALRTISGLLVVKNTNASSPTITPNQGVTVVLPSGAASIGGLVDANSIVLLRFTSCRVGPNNTVVFVEKVGSSPIG